MCFIMEQKGETFDDTTPMTSQKGCFTCEKGVLMPSDTNGSAKILAVAPYEGLAISISRVAERFENVELTAVVGNLDDGVKAAQAAGIENFDLIVSRGGTAELLRQNVDLLVIDIPTSAFDVLQAIKLSEGVGGKRAVVGFSGVTNTARKINDVLQLGLDIFTLVSSNDVRSVLEMLRERSYQTVLCDVISSTVARELGLSPVLITSGEESIADALENAVRINDYMRKEREESLVLRTLLRNHSGETVVLSRSGATYFSSVAEHDNGQLFTYLRELLPEVESGNITYARKSIGGYLYSIRTSVVLGARQPLFAFYFSRSRTAARASRQGITFFTRKDAQKAYDDSFYSLTGDITRIDAQLRDVLRSGSALLISGEYGTGRTAVADYAYVNSDNSNRPLVQIDVGQLDDRGREFLIDNTSSPLYDIGTTIHLKDFDFTFDGYLDKLFRAMAAAETCERNRVIFSCDPLAENVQSYISDIKDEFRCVEVTLPPAREIRERIPAIANLYLSKLNAELPKETLRIDEQAMQLLSEYRWPGNFIQFSRVMRQLCITSRDHVIRAGSVRSVLAMEQPIYHRENHDLGIEAYDLDATLEDIEAQVIEEVVRRHGGNQSAAAKQLGISRTTLWRRLGNS